MPTNDDRPMGTPTFRMLAIWRAFGAKARQALATESRNAWFARAGTPRHSPVARK